MKNLPELTPPTRRFLVILKKYEGKEINLGQYAKMLKTSRRWVRMMMSELREKGYVSVQPENMRIHKSRACRYIFLDQVEEEIIPELKVNDEILKRLGIN